MSNRPGDTPSGHETIHESPPLRALLSLPKKFNSIHEWAELALRHGLSIQRCPEEPEKTGDYLFSYAIETSKGFVFFGARKDNPKKLVVGKRPFTPFEIPISSDSSGDFNSAKKLSAKYSDNARLELEALTGLIDNNEESTPYCVKLIESILYEYSRQDQGQVPFIIMEFVAPGEDLLSFFEHSITTNTDIHFRSEFAAATGLQLIHVLKSLKKLGLVHRDLKPENIMIQNPEGNLGFLVVADFNAAIQAAEYETASVVTSPTIVPPERLLKINPNNWKRPAYDPHAVDLYALGCVLFYLCTGKFPYRGENLEQVQNDMIQAPHLRPALELRDAGIKRDLGELIVQMIDFVDYKRGDLNKIEAALQKIVDNSPYAELVGHLDESISSVNQIRHRVTVGTSTITDSRDLWRHDDKFETTMAQNYPESRGVRPIK